MAHTLSQVKDMIASRLEKRKVLAKSTLDFAVGITSNRKERVTLSAEIKELNKEGRQLRKAEKTEAVAAAKAAKAAKKTVKASPAKEPVAA